uniref:Olfactory receptor n=1 Tax=Xenopus tropicalis TaxID=8364 RepID=A0A6I8QB20_XENTR
MENSNETSFNRFFLLSLADTPYLKAFSVLIFLIMYLLTLSVNSLLIIVVRINLRLHTPMYFFLSNLSIIDIGISTSIVPKLIIITITQDTSISRLDCASQMFFHSALGATECIILAVMAYDRYVAICKPLHYNTITNKRFCISMAAACWALGCINSSFHVPYIFHMSFCRSHHVNHFFCELPVFFPLSCQDTWLQEVSMYISACIIGLIAFILILFSYAYIISTILSIRSTKGRHKAFSTCASHLTVVSLYYGPLMFMYLRPHSRNSPSTERTVSIIYTVVTPMLNPLIYSVRNKDIKVTLRGRTLGKGDKGSFLNLDLLP